MRKAEMACDFEECRLLAVKEAGYCPRHAFLVESFGLERAQHIECGYVCELCKARTDEPCEKCETCSDVRCAACAKEAKCCKGQIECLEQEIEEAEDTVSQLERERDTLQDKLRNRKGVAA